MVTAIILHSQPHQLTSLKKLRLVKRKAELYLYCSLDARCGRSLEASEA